MVHVHVLLPCTSGQYPLILLYLSLSVIHEKKISFSSIFLPPSVFFARAAFRSLDRNHEQGTRDNNLRFVRNEIHSLLSSIPPAAGLRRSSQLNIKNTGNRAD